MLTVFRKYVKWNISIRENLSDVDAVTLKLFYMNERIEKNIEKYFCSEVKKLGGTTIKVGKNGNPDRLAVLPFRLMHLVELKAKGKKLSPKQRGVHAKLSQAGAWPWVLDGKDSVDDFIEHVKIQLNNIQNNYTTYLNFICR